jgi:hypothetical protein
VPIRECLWLVKNGIPFDIAFTIDDVTRAGWAIIFSEMEGNTFDFDTMSFKET